MGFLSHRCICLFSSGLDFVKFLSLPTKGGSLNLESSVLDLCCCPPTPPVPESIHGLEKRSERGETLLSSSSLCGYPASPLHHTHQYWQPTLQLLPPTLLASGHFSSRELAAVPPKIICPHREMKFTRSPITFSLKSQIYNIYRTPFILLLSNPGNGKWNSGKENQPILPHPLRFTCFLFSLSAGLACLSSCRGLCTFPFVTQFCFPWCSGA